MNARAPAAGGLMPVNTVAHLIALNCRTATCPRGQACAQWSFRWAPDRRSPLRGSGVVAHVDSTPGMSMALTRIRANVDVRASRSAAPEGRSQAPSSLLAEAEQRSGSWLRRTTVRPRNSPMERGWLPPVPVDDRVRVRALRCLEVGAEGERHRGQDSLSDRVEGDPKKVGNILLARRVHRRPGGA
jgi:hypothetical protein